MKNFTPQMLLRCITMFALPVAALGQQTAENQLIPEADVRQKGDFDGAIADFDRAIELGSQSSNQ
jgi:hypothetical protein